MKKTTLENLSLALVVAVLLGLGLLPAVPQDLDYHGFADSRGWGGLPNAWDVLSNLCFVAVGLWGLHVIRRTEGELRGALNLFAMGLVLTGLGSAYYHLAPSNETLVWDRLPMTLAFAGALGAMAHQYVAPSAVFRWQNAWLYLGCLSVAVWAQADDLRLYLAVQAGGFLLGALWMAASLRAPAAAAALPWHWVWLGYGLAKAAEAADQWIWQATEGLLAGHALKHVFASLGVACLWQSLAAQTKKSPARLG